MKQVDACTKISAYFTVYSKRKGKGIECDREKQPKKDANGKERIYVVSPYQMVAKEGKYYLICNYDKYLEGVPREHLLFWRRRRARNRCVCGGAWFPAAEITIMPTE